MDLGSPDTFSVDNGNICDKDGSNGGKLELNLACIKERGYDQKYKAWGDRTQEDLSHQHYETSPVPADVSSVKLESPDNRSSSQVHYELYDDNEREKHIESNGDGFCCDTGVASGRYSDKSPSPAEAAHIHSDLEMDDPAHISLKFPLAEGSTNHVAENTSHPELLMENSGYVVIEQEDADHLLGKEDGDNETQVEDSYYSGTLLTNDGELEGRKLPVREISVSPKRAPNLQCRKLSASPQGLHDSPRSSKQKISPSSERTAGHSRRDLSDDHVSLSVRRSPSRRSRRDSPRRDESLLKRLSSSPRKRQLSPDPRRVDRSVSRSPTRQRDSSYGSRRDRRDRSRSRSPHAREHYRRSPRRYSPRRRSPPRHHSRRRSPRRKPWSPPHNRDNGAGRPGNNIFVAGFNFVTTEKDLERKFSRFGRVRDVRIVRDKR
ncbi:hypothetical protein IFM89_006443 [Coptis chinensis]|uniref:RRM domain-containing protein n=1 Tax=Coptis chinensis TaxID=261450 RepID=A0A835LV44_9MAGN|nr:hypothetical protein IFM89_006443 [Coptis chinensis]